MAAAQGKHLACWNCPRYDRALRQCREGKTNPKKKSDSVTVAETLGLRALCHYNLFRDGLAARMHFPHQPIARSAPHIPKRRGDRRVKTEIEIEDNAGSQEEF